MDRYSEILKEERQWTRGCRIPHAQRQMRLNKNNPKEFTFWQHILTINSDGQNEEKVNVKRSKV